MRDRVNILVIDDLPAQRLTIEASLQDLDERVVCLSSGRDGLKFLLENDAAVILLDVNMPGMDGFETAELIRLRPRTANTPIIFLTADPDEMQIARGYALGAVDYLVCPFVPDVLRTKVKVFVTLSREHERLRVEAEQRVELTREQAARAAAEEQSRRLRVLVEAGGVLTRSLHGSAFEAELLGLMIPLLADEAGLVYPDRSLDRGESVWMRAGSGETAEPIDKPPAELLEPVARVLSTGIPEPICRSDGSGMLAMVWPLEVRGEVHGVLAVSRIASGRVYLPSELELIELMCHRTSIVVENRQLYAALRERDRRKDEFLATLSHELRNPLGAITTASQVLQLTGPGAGPALHASQVIARQAVHLARLVDDLLEVSRVTAGRIHLNREHLDLCEVVKRAVDALASTGRLAPYQVTFAGESVVIDADLARTDQVVTNLLVNAIKYTDPGGRIMVEVAKDGPHARVRVSDSGIGISPELLPKLFEVFVQGRQALDRAEGGLGIGLALVRKLVDLHGGSVEALSGGMNQGSTFVVRFPRLRGRTRALNAEPQVKRTPPMCVLVVDDNRDVRAMLKTLLELEGHHIVEAVNGPQAVRVAGETVPDVSLIDLGLPGFDGLEVGRRLRADLRTRHTFMVAVTGYGQIDDQNRSAESGFDAHLVKPVARERLTRVLAEAARKIAAQRAAEPVGSRSTATPVEASAMPVEAAASASVSQASQVPQAASPPAAVD